MSASSTPFDELREAYESWFDKRLSILLDRLSENAENGKVASDGKALEELLTFDQGSRTKLTDPWGTRFRFETQFQDRGQIVKVSSAGPDKEWDTQDDLLRFEKSFDFFRSNGKRVEEFFNKAEGSGEKIWDLGKLRRIEKKYGFSFDDLEDPFGNPHRLEFSLESGELFLKMVSNGRDGKKSKDDFLTLRQPLGRFEFIRKQLQAQVEDRLSSANLRSDSTDKIEKIFQELGYDVDGSYGSTAEFYTTFYGRSVIENVIRYEESNGRLTSQSRVTIHYVLKHRGDDGLRATADDQSVFQFAGNEFTKIRQINPDSILNTAVEVSASTSPRGIITGRVVDETGARIPGATVELKAAAFRRTTTTDDAGSFAFNDLADGKYRIRFSSAGFKSLTIDDLRAKPKTVFDINAVLEVGTLSTVVTVDVMAVENLVNLTDSKVSTTISKDPRMPREAKQVSFTPRIRRNFSEVAYWNPSLLTTKKGRAEVRFKLPDSTTNWKMYVMANTVNGEVGFVEKKFESFQPVFADLEPPRTLTVGDEIALPVPIRNYTKKTRRLNVSMNGEWLGSKTGLSEVFEVEKDSSANLILPIRAEKVVENGLLNLRINDKEIGDAVEKTVDVLPDGHHVRRSYSKLFGDEASFKIAIPKDSDEASRKVEVTIYPTIYSQLGGAVRGLLQRPYGCGEQTTSSTYPNLLILEFAKNNPSQVNANTQAKAMQFLSAGYERLKQYQTDSGFGYWKGESPDEALTAYVLMFLKDADRFIDVDSAAISKATTWLLDRQNDDGSWGSAIVTAGVARSLSMQMDGNPSIKKSVEAAFKYLHSQKVTSNSHLLYTIADVSANLRQLEQAREYVRLGDEAKGANRTSFYGWGRAAEIEAKGVKLSVLLKLEDSEKKSEKDLAMSLIESKDEHGVWYSTQTTVQVLKSLLKYQNKSASSAGSGTFKVFLNGELVKELKPQTGDTSPLEFMIRNGLTSNNEIKIQGGNGNASANLINKYYADWKDTPLDKRFFNFSVDCGRYEVRIMETVKCKVQLEKKYAGSGMLLVEIGTPPGAAVDVTPLERLKTEGFIDQFDVQPDRIVLYLPGGQRDFNFDISFRPRYGIKAMTPRSIVYDYYNEEAKALVKPKRFVVSAR